MTTTKAVPVKIEDLKEVKRNNNLIVSKFETLEDLQKLRNSERKVLMDKVFQFNR